MASLSTPTTLTGVVVSAGRMMKAVKVRTTKQKHNNFLKKHFAIHPSHLVSDPTSALRTGDIVRITPWRTSRHIGHIVTEILAPFGRGIDERPRVLSEEERWEIYRLKRERKAERKEERRKAAEGAGAGAEVERRGEERAVGEVESKA